MHSENTDETGIQHNTKAGSARRRVFEPVGLRIKQPKLLQQSPIDALRLVELEPERIEEYAFGFQFEFKQQRE